MNGVKEYRYFAGGEWRTAENHKLFDVFRPYDRGLYARVAAGGRPEAKLAVDAAAKAYPAWSQTTRDSGWGRTGPDSLKEFQDLIWINSHSGQRQYPI